MIHTINIKQKREKQLFQISLPENAESITGIAVTCDQYMIFKTGFVKVERQAGTLALFSADTGEHIFSDNPRAAFAPPTWQKFDEVSFDRQLWLTNKHFAMLDTNQPVSCTLLDGFYHDEVGKLLDEVNYNVRIYLRLKLL